MTIWKTENLTLDFLNKRGKNTLVESLGIEVVEIGSNFLKAKMPVDKRTHQPLGILHGGASVALAETVGSMASNFCLDNTKEYSLGLDINSNHIKSVSSGFVFATAKPIHIGRKTHIWEIKINNEKDELINISRLTMMVMQIPI